MTVFSRHPVDGPVITQPWGANRTGGVVANPNGSAVQQLVFNYGNYQPAGHDGIDYGCQVGTPVYAPGDGVVDYAGWGQDMPQWVALKYGFIYGPDGWASGVVTCIDHGPIGSYVAHKSESYMDNRVGQRIKGGTVVGLSGNTGRSGGPHVHFSAIRFPVNYSDALYSRVNPLDYFSTVTVTPISPGSQGSAATTPDPEEDFMGGTIDAQQADDIARAAARYAREGLVGEILAALDNKVRINAVQAESVVQATVKRVGDQANGKTINLKQAEDIARAAGSYAADEQAERLAPKKDEAK